MGHVDDLLESTPCMQAEASLVESVPDIMVIPRNVMMSQIGHCTGQII